MKILIICQYFHPEQFKINDICFELVNKGYDVTVLTGLPNYPSGVISSDYKWFRKRHEVINGVEVIRVPLIARGRSKVRLALNYLSFALNATIKAMFMKKDFDVILVYQLSPITMALPALLLKKMTGKKVLLHCHDLWPASISAAGLPDHGVIYRLLLNLSKLIYHRADKIAISSKLFEEYLKDIIGVTVKPSYLPVYAESLFDDISQKNKSDTIDLVFAGNIGEMQSVETIIHAAEKLRDEQHIKWHIVGDGSDRVRCEELAKNKNLRNVFFYGQHPINEMPKFYEMADAFLVTLRANKNISYTLPNKVQSYMAAGKPIIGSIDGETQLVLNEAQCGLCCTAEDSNGLALIVKKFVTERDRHLMYGQNARHYYEENFAKQTFFQRLTFLIQQIA